MRHNLTQAAELAGISRAALYATYINKGLLSVCKDHRGRPYVETAELVRVFGVLDSLSKQLPITMQDDTDTELALLRQELQHQRALMEAKDRELELANRLIFEKDQRLLLLDNKLTTQTDTSRQPKRQGLFSFFFSDKADKS